MYYYWDVDFTVEQKITFYLMIWYAGDFQSNILNHLQKVNSQSIRKYTKILEDLGFLTIDNKINPNTSDLEKFYFISQKNFKGIFNHLCRSVKSSFNENVFISLLKSKKPFSVDVVNAFLDDLIFDDLLDNKKLFNLLNRSFSTFFYFVIKLGSSIDSNSTADIFMKTIYTQLSDINSK